MNYTVKIKSEFSSLANRRFKNKEDQDSPLLQFKYLSNLSQEISRLLAGMRHSDEHNKKRRLNMSKYLRDLHIRHIHNQHFSVMQVK